MLNNKILIIDNDQLIIHSIRRSLILEKNDYEIITANNGQEGLDKYYKEEPILVLLDLDMPLMGGIEFLKEINLSPTDACSIIVLTGLSDEKHVKECFDLGVSAFLRKPFNQYEFFGMVRHVILFKKVQQVLKDKCNEQKIAHRNFKHEKQKLISSLMNKVKSPLIPIVNCTKALLEGRVISEEERIRKLQEIQDASQALVDVFENPSGN